MKLKKLKGKKLYTAKEVLKELEKQRKEILQGIYRIDPNNLDEGEGIFRAIQVIKEYE